ncbi:hypothetical protein KSP40_PGU005876 [Platanthera guangdongensis]|uniref:Uncharacterized protein n=1 Tax=Platanthera guangdongensis TaxID=2320717 RepID=A0ABR2MFU7_9ASPA
MTFSLIFLYCVITADEGSKDSDVRSINSANKEKPAADPIIVPIVLKMTDFDHKVLICFIILYFHLILLHFVKLLVSTLYNLIHHLFP